MSATCACSSICERFTLCAKSGGRNITAHTHYYDYYHVYMFIDKSGSPSACLSAMRLHIGRVICWLWQKCSTHPLRTLNVWGWNLLARWRTSDAGRWKRDRERERKKTFHHIRLWNYPTMYGVGLRSARTTTTTAVSFHVCGPEHAFNYHNKRMLSIVVCWVIGKNVQNNVYSHSITIYVVIRWCDERWASPQK